MERLLIICTALILSLTVFAPHHAYAQGDIVCIAIFPCEKDTGELLPQFADRSSACYPQFKKQCETYQYNLMQGEVTQCKKDKAETEIRLAKKVRSLKRRLREKRSSKK